MGRKLWKVFIIFTLVFGMTVSFGTSKAEAEGEPAPTASAETTENPQESAVTTVDPGAVPEPTETADIATETPVAPEESTAEPQETPAETEAPVETDVSVMMAKSFVTNTVSEPTETPAEDNTPKTYDLSGDQKKWIDLNNTSLKVEDTDGNYTDLENLTSIPEYAKFQMNVKFRIPDYTEGTTFPGIKDTDTIQFAIPQGVRSFQQTSGSIEGGSWKIEDRYFKISFDSDFLKKSGGYGATGTLSLKGILNDTYSEGGTTSVPEISFLGKACSNYTVTKRTGGIANIDLKKTAISKTHLIDGDNNSAIRSARYQVEVKAGKFSENVHNTTDLTGINVHDVFHTQEKYQYKDDVPFVDAPEFEKYISYGNVSVSIRKADGSEIPVYQNDNPVETDGRSVSVTDDNKGGKDFKLNGPLHPDESLIITYDANVDEEMYEDRPLGKSNENNTYSSANSGDAAHNAVDNGDNRSWIERRASNTATVTSDGQDKPETATVEQQDSGKGDWFLTFKKTWLWKGTATDPKPGQITDWQISVNEGDHMPLAGYVLTDDLSNKNQTIVSDVKIVDEDNGNSVLSQISLADLKSGNVSVNWAGSTTEKIQFIFPENSNHHYRVYYSTQTSGASRIEAHQVVNTATLAEPDNIGSKKDDYGVAKEVNLPAATVTKRAVSLDAGQNLIHWQTTIADGVEIKNGSRYEDYVFALTKGRSDNNATESDDKDLQKLTPETLHLNITVGSGDNAVPLTEGTDYSLSFTKANEVKKAVSSCWNHKLTSGYSITFKKNIEHGPVIITYDSMTDLSKVDYQADFHNLAKYFANGDDQETVHAEASIVYEANGALEKFVQANDGNHITWILKINNKKYQNESGYVVKDSIPAGLNFDLHDLNPMEMYYSDGTNTNICANDQLINSFNKENITNDGSVQKYQGQYFDAEYNTDTRELKLVIKKEASNLTYTEFGYVTSVKVDALQNANQGEVSFNNTAELYSNGSSPSRITASEATATVKKDLLTKTETYDQSTAPDVKYQITVNNNGIQLAPEKHVVYVEDSGMQAPLIFKHDSLKITDHAGNQYTEGNKADAEKHTYKFENTDNGFRITVPDQTALTISYSAYAPGVTGDKISTSNNVDLFADGTKLQTRSAGRTNIDWIKPNLSLEAADRIRIRKTDANVPSRTLKGAVFAIYKANGNDYSTKGDLVGEITTDHDGIAYSYKSEKGYQQLHLDTDQVYLIKEITAPGKESGNDYPYYLKNTDYVGKFYITDKNASSDNTAIRDLRENHPDVVLINHGYLDYTFDCQNSEIQTTSLKAAKVWKDNNNQDGKRQDVTFHLNAKVNGNDVSYFIDAAALKDQTIAKDAENQTVEWKNLPVTDSEGNKIDYSVSEDPMDGYTSDVTGNQNEGFTVTNTHTPETVQVSGAKTWNDAEYLNQNGYERPASIEVSVNGTIDGRTVETEKKTVTADDNWTYTFDNLPKYNHGREITYVVSETKVGEKTPSEAGYESEVSANGRDIVNTPKKAEKDDLTSVKLTVIKRDRKSAKHALLKDTTFRIKKDDSDLTVSGTTDENGQVTLNIPEEGVYTLTETKAPEGYTISDEMQKGLKVEVTKSDTDHVKLTVENNENVFQKATHLILGEKDHFTCGFDERTNSGVVEVSNDPVTKDIHTDKVVNDTPEKETPSSDKADKVLHLNKTVDGKTETVETKTVKATDQDVVWKDQPLYEDGHKVTYTVTEESVPAEHSETPDTADHTNMPLDIGMFGGSMAIVLAALLLRRRYN